MLNRVYNYRIPITASDFIKKNIFCDLLNIDVNLFFTLCYDEKETFHDDHFNVCMSSYALLLTRDISNQMNV